MKLDSDPPYLVFPYDMRHTLSATIYYFNNHYGGKAVVNALEFKEMIGMSVSEKERKVLEEAQLYLSKQNS